MLNARTSLPSASLGGDLRLVSPAPAIPRRLSVLIPAYNEEATIAAVLERVAAMDLTAVGFDHEIVVCDDGSSDRTVELIAAAARRDPRIRLVVHPRNRGKGAAIRSALAVAGGEFCIVQDADLEYETGDYPALLAALAPGVRVVYGSRFARRRWPSGMRWPNWVANRILTLTANLLFGLRISDEATCLKLFDTELLRSLDLRAEGFDFCPEVTAKIGARREPIAEVPIAYRARTGEEGKKIRWTDGVHAIATLVALRFRR